ncbi:enterochelin esterase domain-containing protein [Roseibium sp. SCP14]|uniref:enterochelin esterase domain-containing protein n=1 Tax=Roseibium sp. SCP14 TaxID=3141375 RepID=UPI003338078E
MTLSVLVVPERVVQAAENAPSSSEAAGARTIEPTQRNRNTHWQDTLNPEGAAQRLRLDFEPGTYVAGKLSVIGNPLHLDLVSETGDHIRRLVDADGYIDGFHFIVPPDTTYLKVHSPEKPGDRQTGFHIEFNKVSQPLTEQKEQDAAANPLSPALHRLMAGSLTKQTIDEFWSELESKGTPLIEPVDDGTSIVTFFYRGAKSGVHILGSPSADHDPMYRLESTDIWYRSYRLPTSTRLSYRLAPDVPNIPGTYWERRVAILATAQADPLNKSPWPLSAADPYNQKSVVELPGAPKQPFAGFQNAVQGTVEHFSFTSKVLENTRRISLYTPPGFDPDDPETVLLVLFDGAAYQSLVSVPTILDNMHAARTGPQTAAVLISNPNMETRSRELPGDSGFANMVAREIIPLAQGKLGRSISPERTVVAGSSFGGLAATRLALEFPNVFGNVISMSGSFWWSPDSTPGEEREYTANRVAALDTVDVRFFLTAGLYETGRAGELDILSTNRHLKTVLQAKGYDVKLREYAGAHDYLVWQGALSDGLISLFGGSDKTTPKD